MLAYLFIRKVVTLTQSNLISAIFPYVHFCLSTGREQWYSSFCWHSCIRWHSIIRWHSNIRWHRLVFTHHRRLNAISRKMSALALSYKSRDSKVSISCYMSGKQSLPKYFKSRNMGVTRLPSIRSPNYEDSVEVWYASLEISDKKLVAELGVGTMTQWKKYHHPPWNNGSK